MSRIELDLGSRPKPRAWLLRHAQTLLYTLGLITRTPVGSLLSASVIGVALALPSGLHALLDNAMRLGAGWELDTRISLFLAPAVTDADAARLGEALRREEALQSVRVITRAEALAEYKRLSGFADVLEAFGGANPLPTVLVVEPGLRQREPARVAALLERLEARPEVELAQFDVEWLMRFRAIVEILRRAVAVLAALLALGVVLIVGNTIRLAIENRRSEIEIAKLCGATDAFIRRPFLYTGLWYGGLGGIIAWLLVQAGFALLVGPAADLAALYDARIALRAPGPGSLAGLAAVGASLGLAGSWVAVGRHLRAIEPG